MHASTPAPSTSPKSNTLFVARQPILNAEEGVFGYELLFRDGVVDYCSGVDIEGASRSTLSASTLMGLDALCDGRMAFINVTRDVLLGGYITLLPAAQVVVEVLETVTPDEPVAEACRLLKEAGYQIALDDFVAGDPREALAGLADVIKVDLRQTSLQDASAMARRLSSRGCRMLAEKVETREEFAAVRSAGFELFQGYFFRRPELLTAHEIPANQLNYLRMWQTVSKPELNLREVESVIKSEASLCYRLLRYLNSPVFGFGNEISSIRHALTILGEREIRRWVRLVATLGAGQNKSSELVLSALIRARFCELLSSSIQHGGSDLFLVGLLSLMDAILEIPMTQVLENIPVDRESKEVLMGGGSRLRPVYDLMLAQETGEWQTCGELARGLRLHENEVPQKYWEAVQWAREVNGR